MGLGVLGFRLEVLGLGLGFEGLWYRFKRASGLGVQCFSVRA